MKIPNKLRGLGNVAGFATDQLGFLRKLADRGDFVELEMLGKPWFLVSHPDDIETVIVKHARVMGRDQYVDVLRRTLGMGLTTRQIPVQVDSYLVHWALVKQGAGIGFMTEAVGDAEPSVRRVLPEAAPIVFPVWLVTHRELHTSRRVRVVFDLLAYALSSQR